MIPKETAEKRSKKIVQMAKNDMASRKRSNNHNIEQMSLENVSHEIKQPVTFMGDPVKAFEHRQKNKIKCCICGISSGTFYIKDGKKYCSNHKQFMSMDEEKKELSTC